VITYDEEFFSVSLGVFSPLSLKEMGIDRRYISYQNNIMSIVECHCGKFLFSLLREHSTVTVVMQYSLPIDALQKLFIMLRRVFNIGNDVEFEGPDQDFYSDGIYQAPDNKIYDIHVHFAKLETLTKENFLVKPKNPEYVQIQSQNNILLKRKARDD
jgi:hypothetical protein